VTLRVERSCSGAPTLPEAAPPPVIYPYTEALPRLNVHRRLLQGRL
jgi:hypothetical protein